MTAGAEDYVVVTVAPNGVVHVWGSDDGRPFASRAGARAARYRLLRQDRANFPDRDPVTARTCLIMSTAVGPMMEME